MTEADPADPVGGAGHHDEGATASRGLAEWLRLAATPTFAMMALLTGMGGSPIDSLCLSGHGFALSGMVTMYLLMSAFHSPPWLNLIRGPPAPFPNLDRLG
jgi:hypothetical protein